MIAVTPRRVVDTRPESASLGFVFPFGQPGLGGSDPAERAIPILLGPFWIPATARAYDFTGTTADRVITVRIDGVSTAVSCGATTASPTCNNTSNTAAVPAGSTVAYLVTAGASAINAPASFVCQ